MADQLRRQVYGYPTSLTSTLFFLTIFVIAFFPGVFHSIAILPLSPLRFLFSNPTPTATLVPSPLPSTSFPPGLVSSSVSNTFSDSKSTLKMSWFQKTIHLPPKARGSYLITDHVVKELAEIKTYKIGLLHLFVQHTSCALSLNENWDSDVREDMSDALDRIVPDDKKGELYRHSAEGVDDMPV